MIVSTDKQAFAVTIMVKGCDDDLSASPANACTSLEEKDMETLQDEQSSYPLEKSQHIQDVVSGLDSLRKDGLLLDVKLWAQGQVFQAHRVVLASCSEYFRAMFTSGLKESTDQDIVLGGMTSLGLSRILDYVYTGRVQIDADCVEQIIECASHLQILPVLSKCGHFLIDNLELENCVDVLTIGDNYSMDRVRHSAFRFMAENLSVFRRSGELEKLTLDQLLNLLHSNFPVDVAEGEVLAMVVDWLESDLPSRANLVNQILDGVRLSEVPGNYISGLLDRPGLKAVKDRLKTLERLSPIRQSDTYKMVNSRGMKMAMVKVGGFGPSGITNDISYYHCGSQAEENWRQLATIPHVECCNFGCAVLHNQLYIVGGCFNQGLQENIHPFGFRYCARQDKWTTISAMIRERCRFSLTECGGRLFAVGGCSEAAHPQEEDLTSVEVYSPHTDLWSPCAGLPGGNRSQHAAVRVGDRLYISGGLDHGTLLGDLLEYEPASDMWHQVCELPLPRADHSMVTYQDIIYLVGGWREGQNGRLLVPEIHRYDLSTNSWRVETILSTPRYNAGITLHDGKIFIIGGFLDDEMFDRSTSAVDCYDIAKGQWIKEKPFPHHTWEHGLLTLQVPVSREDAALLS